MFAGAADGDKGFEDVRFGLAHGVCRLVRADRSRCLVVPDLIGNMRLIEDAHDIRLVWVIFWHFDSPKG